MATFDPADLLVGFSFPDSGVELVALASGALFPARLNVMARLDDGPVLDLFIEVEEDRPVLSSITIARAPDGPPITGCVVHDLPVGRIADEVIARLGTTALAMFRAERAKASDVPHRFLTPDEVDRSRRDALVARRRPVTEALLHQVANVVRNNPYDPRRQVANQLYTSERTASRWIAEAKRRGFLTEEEGNDG